MFPAFFEEVRMQILPKNTRVNVWVLGASRQMGQMISKAVTRLALTAHDPGKEWSPLATCVHVPLGLSVSLGVRWEILGHSIVAVGRKASDSLVKCLHLMLSFTLGH